MDIEGKRIPDPQFNDEKQEIYTVTVINGYTLCSLSEDTFKGNTEIIAFFQYIMAMRFVGQTSYPIYGLVYGKQGETTNTDLKRVGKVVPTNIFRNIKDQNRVLLGDLVDLDPDLYEQLKQGKVPMTFKLDGGRLKAFFVPIKERHDSNPSRDSDGKFHSSDGSSKG